MKLQTLSRATAAALLLVACQAAPTLAAEAGGAALAWRYHCITCHGPGGKSNASRYPNIAGQNAPYLVARLNYFRDEVEPGNQMNAQAAPLSDDDIAKLADYFSRLPN